MDETGAADLDFQRSLASARLPSMKSEIAFHWNKVNMPDMVSDTSKHNIGLPDAMGCYTSAGYVYSREMGQCIKPGGGDMTAGIEPAPPSLPAVFAPISNICDFGAAYLCSQSVAPAGTVTDGPVDSFASILDMSGIGPMTPGGSSYPVAAPSSVPKVGPGKMIPPSTMPIRPDVPATLAPGVRPFVPSSVPAQLAPGVKPIMPMMEPAYQTVSSPGELFQWENTETGGLNRFVGNLSVATHAYK
jgi:hypothetical protein